MSRMPDANLVSLSKFTETPLADRRFCLCVICWIASKLAQDLYFRSPAFPPEAASKSVLQNHK